VARGAFVSGMDLGLTTDAFAALCGYVIALTMLKARWAQGDVRAAGDGRKAL
jgi:hypothetical protein